MRVQIIISGVGGQGILFSSRLFSQVGLSLGLKVMGAETHGMSQRGGSVTAHLKLGEFQSPLVRAGQADFLYAFDENEAYRTLRFLKGGGVCFVNLADGDRFDRGIRDYLMSKGIDVLAYDASGAALKTGSIMSTNIVLIGYSIGTGLVPFRYRNLRRALESLSRKKNLDMNFKALEKGYRDGKLLKKAR